ncbi:UDP-3-O-[3-hydroxymyristoyl] N-acetylglucosamine deacetylase [Leptospira ryugenii]|uniref:UDP-3-O-acyl-N-acetylglucosamine deacetylase n=1 Tax=Leptospira ryugenii TaxID=1917863 RepID=A0A2P2DX90_9LEPT|nr:UDP-3-O-acyl-N-acetylglucosamine deacetylase [Leptospira ryugenii]GBF49254.1 UDP-3-O-[3-hydroxymyristoyl] N-acetylglucosamine deacetylase [Leptospira ryugenii]
MQTIHRKTIRESLTLKGIGLHSGKTVTLRMHPAEAGTGLVFFLYRNGSKVRIPISLDHVVDTSNATTLGDGGSNRVQTIEHMLAALYTQGITDCILEIDAVEVPIMDGSSRPFWEGIQGTGIQTLSETVEPIRISHPMWVVDGDKYLVILPSDELKVTYHIDFNHPLLKGQSYTTVLDDSILATDILPARTFGFLKDVEALQARGLALGGSLDNAVVLTEDGYLNESLRYENECVRHKILDLIGDLAVMGRPFYGHLIASKAGHALDISLAKCIMSKVTGDELTSFKSKRIPLFAKKEASQ